MTVPDSTSLDLTTGMTLEAGSSRRRRATGFQTARLQGAAAATSSTGSTRTPTRTSPQAQVFIGGTARIARRHRRAARRRLDAPRRHLRRHRRCACTSTAPRSRTLRRPRLDPRPRPARSRIGGNCVWGEWFNGLIDEVRVYNRALTAAEIQNDMITQHHARHDAADGHREDAGAGLGGRQRRHLGHRDVQRVDADEHDHRLDVPAQGLGQRRRPGDRHLRPGDERRDAHAADRAPVRQRPTRRRSRAAPAACTDLVGQPARGRRRPGRSPPRHRRRRSSSSTRRRTRSAATSARSCATRAWTTFTTLDVSFLSPPCSAASMSSCSATSRSRRPGLDADALGQRRREPDRDAPGQAARRPARADGRRHDARERLPQGRHDDRARARASSGRRSSSTAPPTATR